MIELKDRKIDGYGEVVFNEQGLYKVLMMGGSITNLNVEPSNASKQFNTICEQWDMPNCALSLYEPLQGNVDTYHHSRACAWFMPEHYKNLDVKDFLLMKCSTVEEVSRVLEEWELFKERNLCTVLAFLVYLVDYMREHDVVWGVGRGSSVASYCLYLIGIHKINSLEFDLNIREFLK